MTKTALQFLEDAFAKAQFAAIRALNDFHLTQEAYDAKRRAGEECSYEYAVYCDAARKESAASKYASNCLDAIKSARLLPLTEEK